jgi:hypothetical protein
MEMEVAERRPSGIFALDNHKWHGYSRLVPY